MSRQKRTFRLLIQLLLGQLVLVVAVLLTLIGTDLLIAPSIFLRHMEAAGIDTSTAQMHISEAFSSALSVSMLVAAVSALLVATVIAWFLMRRVSQPIENLATYAEVLALGEGSEYINVGSSTREIDRLSRALTGMAGELSKVQEDQARMLRDLAHELRTPIATIGALVDGMEDGIVAADAHSWKTMRDQIDRLNRLSRDVRDVSHSFDQPLSSLKFPTDPMEIANSAMAAWSAQFEAKEVLLEIEGVSNTLNHLPLVTVDPLRVGQILSNLLENALRHTPRTGKVSLIVSTSRDAVSFSVRDTGEGIAPHQLPHIFERLYRGDNARSSKDTGSGLGLPIARKIAEEHGGSLVAVSEGLGRGSLFVLTLPLGSR